MKPDTPPTSDAIALPMDWRSVLGRELKCQQDHYAECYVAMSAGSLLHKGECHMTEGVILGIEYCIARMEETESAREIAAQPGEGERSSGAELMASFENADWNQIRESMEQAVISACTALLAHTEAAGMTLEHEGIAIQIGAISYEGAKS